MKKLIFAVLILFVHVTESFGQGPWPPSPCDTTYCYESWSGIVETVINLPGGCTVVVGYQTRHCPELQVAIVYIQPTGCGSYSAHDLSVYTMQQLLAFQGRAIPQDSCREITIKRYACFEIDTILDPWGGPVFAPWFVNCNNNCCTINTTVCKYNDSTYFIYAHHTSGTVSCDTNPMFPGPCTFGCDTVGLTNIVHHHYSRPKNTRESEALEVRGLTNEPQVLAGTNVINVPIRHEGEYLVSIYDSHGKMIRKTRVHLLAGRRDIELPINKIASGLYEVKLTGESDVIYQRVVVP